MLPSEFNPTLLYLPLLNDPSMNVRRQACTILLSTYGDHGITLLRRLLSVNDMVLRQQVRTALEHIRELSDLLITPEAFHGIFIKCLGNTRIFVDSQEIHLDSWVRKERGQVGWQKVQGVLGYLIHCGMRGTTRASLEAAVWGSAPAATVGRTLQALHQMFSKLRDDTFAKQALTLADNYCLLRPEVYRTDVQAFERAFSLATKTDDIHGLTVAAPLYSQALQLYGGPYMIDMPRGASWAETRRDHLRSSFLIAAECVAKHVYAEQRYEECVLICSQIFDVDESADEVVALLLRSYMKLGHRGALEHIYRRYLKANTIDDVSFNDSQDLVVRTYRELHILLPS